MSVETRLREALRAGAELIEVEDVPREDHALPWRPGWRVVSSLVVAAAVVVVAVVLAVSVGRSTHSAPPAHVLSGSPAVPRPVDGLHPVRCDAANSGDVSMTLGHAVLPNVELGQYDTLLGIDTRGTAVVMQPPDSRAERLVAVARDGSQEPLFIAPSSVPGQGPASLGGGSTDGDWAVFTIMTGGGQGGLSGIDVVNTQTRTLHVVRDAALGDQLIVQSPIIVRGVVYWSEVTNFGDGHVFSYDIASGRRHTLDSGQVGWPFTVGGGVYWAKGAGLRRVVTHVAGALPPGYVVRTKDNATIVVDGDRVAWADHVGTGSTLQLRIGSGEAVRLFRLPVGNLDPTALTGHYLWWEDSGGVVVLDLRTGATARLDVSASWQRPVAPVADGFLALNVGTAAGTRLAVIDTKTLPKLQC